MDIYTLLHKDHEAVKALFQKLEDTTEKAVKGREKLFETLKEELTVHAEAEEQFFYPKLLDTKDSRPIALEAQEEHNVVKALLAQLALEPKGSEEWTAKLAVLQENVEHHAMEEETELFPKAKKILSGEQARSIAIEVQQYKDSQLGMMPRG